MRNTFYEEIIQECEKIAGCMPHTSELQVRYHGNHSLTYELSVPQTRTIAKTFKKLHPDLSLDELLDISTLLFQNKTHEGKSIASYLLCAYPKLRKQFNPQQIDAWLDHLEGWCQVDCLCQSTFTAEELLGNWPTWKKLIEDLSQSNNINKRRASLVLLTKPVGQSSHTKLSTLAFAMIEQLKGEKSILITKAISWLLRSLVHHHKDTITEYITKQKDTLPAIAVRETIKKITTGKKNTTNHIK